MTSDHESPLTKHQAARCHLVSFGLSSFSVLTLCVPWLIPPVFGPSPPVVPLLISWASLLLYLLLVRFNTSANMAHHIGSAWLLAAVVSSLFAFIQYFGWSADFSPIVSHAAAGEAFANLRQRNQFATLTSIGLLVLLVSANSRVALTLGLGSSAIYCAVLIAAANAATGSRTGLVQMGLLWGLFQLWCVDTGSQGAGRAIRNAAALSYVASALILFHWAGDSSQGSGGGVLERVQDGSVGCSSRLILWGNVLQLVKERPWTGWGWGELDYAHFMTLYSGERFCEILDNAHNFPLHLAVELGLPLALLICCLAVRWVLRNAPWREKNPERQIAWGVLVLVALHSMVEYPLWYGQFQAAFVLCLTLLWSTNSSRWGAWMFPFSGSVLRYATVLAGVVSIAFFAYVAWDYWRISQLYLAPSTRAEAYREDTYEKVKGTWLFQNQVQFAHLSTNTLNRGNAAERNEQAKKLLHFSPEPRVVEAVIESAVMLGKDEEALYYLQRYKAAFPEAHAQWAAALARDKTP